MSLNGRRFDRYEGKPLATAADSKLDCRVGWKSRCNQRRASLGVAFSLFAAPPCLLTRVSLLSSRYVCLYSRLVLSMIGIGETTHFTSYRLRLSETMETGSSVPGTAVILL